MPLKPNDLTSAKGSPRYSNSRGKRADRPASGRSPTVGPRPAACVHRAACDRSPAGVRPGRLAGLGLRPRHSAADRSDVPVDFQVIDQDRGNARPAVGVDQHTVDERFVAIDLRVRTRRAARRQLTFELLRHVVQSQLLPAADLGVARPADQRGQVVVRWPDLAARQDDDARPGFAAPAGRL